jgi:hypothetical protein
MKAVLLFAIVASLNAPAALAAQAGSGIGAGIGYEAFSFNSPEAVTVRNVSLLTVPAGLRIGLGGFSLGVQSAWASARLERSNGVASTIEGPTDTEVRLEYGLRNGLLLLTAIAQLPTGKSTLSTEEIDVAGAIAADVLPFRISNWGSGGGAGVSAATTVPMGQYAAGISLGYVAAQEFEPVSGQAVKYRPGDQFSIRAAVDRTIGRSGKIGLMVAAQRFAADQADGNNLFQAGDRYEAVASYAFAMGPRGTGLTYVGYLRRQKGEFTGSTLATPIEGLFFMGGGYELPVRTMLFRPRVDLRVLSRQDGVGQGYTLSGGADVEFSTGYFIVVPTLRARMGNLILTDVAESGFVGCDVGRAIRFGNFDQ